MVWDEARLRFVKSFCQVQRAREIKLEVSISTWCLLVYFSASCVNFSLHFICNVKYPNPRSCPCWTGTLSQKKTLTLQFFWAAVSLQSQNSLDLSTLPFQHPYYWDCSHALHTHFQGTFCLQKGFWNGSRNRTSLGLLQLWFHSLPFLCGSRRVSLTGSTTWNSLQEVFYGALS